MNLRVISGLFEQVSAGKGCHGVCQKNCNWVSQCNSESLAVIKTFTTWPIPHPDLISNCPYCVLCNSYDVVWEILALDQVIIPVIDIFLYSHPLYAWYCTDLWGETLSWSLAIKGLAAVFMLFTLLYILFLLFWQGEFVQNQAIPNLVLMFDKREIL